MRSFYLAACLAICMFADAQVKVACIGNSVTYGYGIPNRDSACYPARLQSMLGPGYRVVNFGHSGATLLRHGHRPYAGTPEFAAALAFRPDIAVIDLGLNDTDPRDWPDHRDEFAADYAWLIDTLRSVNPSMRIDVCLMTPVFHDHPRFRSGTREWYGQIQALLPDIARAGDAGCVDLHTPLSSHPEMFADALHPDARGAAIMAQTLYGILSGDYGGLKLAACFGAHMVLQRDRPIPVYGTADAGAEITASLAGNTATARAGKDGRWRLVLPPLPAGGPHRLRVSGERRVISLDDVLMGDVWLCSGQSNMEFPLSAERAGARALALPVDAGLRLYRLRGLAPTDSSVWGADTLAAVNDLHFFSGQWTSSDARWAAGFSAVAYYFGKRLRDSLRVPIGLIQVTVGGSPLDAWIPRDTMEGDPYLVNLLHDWRHSDFQMPWCRERASVNLAGAASPAQRHPFDPCYDYEAGIAPLTASPIRGVLWYQGESDAFHPEYYRRAFPVLVASWRAAWGYDLPFYFVQLSGTNRPDWPVFRDMQRQLPEMVPHCGMAVSSDQGDKDNVHPRDKRPVGERLAAAVLHDVYGRDLEPSGPTPITAVGDSVVAVTFAHADGLSASGDRPLGGFEWFDRKGVSHPAAARVDGRTVVLTCGPDPQRVVYSWEPFPDGNLVNGSGLPATTFSLPVTRVVPRSAAAPWSMSTYYGQRLTHFRTLPAHPGAIVFLGNSITDGAEWAELFDDPRVINRGISGDATAGVLYRLREVTDRHPSKIFLLIGINDLAAGRPPDSVAGSILRIADSVRILSPGTQLYVQSLLPVNDRFPNFPHHSDKGEAIRRINHILLDSAERRGYSFIDLHDAFQDAAGRLDSRYTNDGLHLTGVAYRLWKSLLYPSVNDRQPRPALLPLPRSLRWEYGYFGIDACKGVYTPETALADLARAVADSLRLPLLGAPSDSAIVLSLASPAGFPDSEEAYALDVRPAGIILRAPKPHGIYDGLQTLFQLARDGVRVPACTILDWPAFPWRGYMADVGRNYQSPALLRQQIDVMARYKLNRFHLHLTEDLAWRLESRLYPALTAPATMQRGKGLYYTIRDIQGLSAYCRARYITLVPELDMPGHSAAFRRAMGVDMQTDSGMVIAGGLLKELCRDLDVPFIHMGGDEVKMTRADFLERMGAEVASQGRRPVAWSPGGSPAPGTILQLWAAAPAPPGTPIIDSRNLYLNHMDPLECVPSIFRDRIGDRDSSNGLVLGGEVCLWHDRNVRTEEDLIRMNPVYPGLLAFAERSWRGGGDTLSFSGFEDRLIDQARGYLQALPFPYVRQSGIQWKLYGPYPNHGDLGAAFAPERPGFDASPALTATGGTVILRHFWYPDVAGLLEHPADSTTWYARRSYWSPSDTVVGLWAGFYDFSRSTASAEPPAGGWNNLSSRLWLDGEPVTPPQWRRAGLPGDLEIPLTDENYSFRDPIPVHLHKGWNELLVKLPVGSFRAGDWRTPVKWMFTAVLVTPDGLHVKSIY